MSLALGIILRGFWRRIYLPCIFWFSYGRHDISFIYLRYIDKTWDDLSIVEIVKYLRKKRGRELNISLGRYWRFFPVLMTSRRLSPWWYLDVMQSTLMRSLRETIHRAISRKKLITLFVVFKILATHTYINYHWTICEQNKSQVWPWLLVGIPTFEIRAWTWLLSQPNINRVMVSASWGITARYPGYIDCCTKILF